MDRNNVPEPLGSAERRNLQRKSPARSVGEAAAGPARGASPAMLLVLLLGVWAASWATLVSLSSWLAGKGGSRGSPVVRQPETHNGECDAVIAEFIRTRGITRCPTACVLPTQGLVDAADRAALEEHAITQERSRQAKAADRARLFWAPTSPPRRRT
jgi:hypothetical protein